MVDQWQAAKADQLKKGKQYSSECINLLCGDLIRSLNVGSGYKYLGMLEGCDILHNSMKEKIK